jgi:hypothetical protein
MKPALHESLSELIDSARRLQQVIDGERPHKLLAAAALCRLAGDVAEMVHRLEGHAKAIGSALPQGKRTRRERYVFSASRQRRVRYYERKKERGT